MQDTYWLTRWENNDIRFHEGCANALLIEHCAALQLAPAARIFVPFCGKSMDMAWLLSQGYHVIGAELSPLAVQQFFAELGEKPQQSKIGSLSCYQAHNITIFVGDFFTLTAAMVGSIDAVYDRAALVALPPAMRPLYSKHLLSVCQQAPQLLIAYDYDQTAMPGPPFSVPRTEINQHYAKNYRITLQQTQLANQGHLHHIAAKEQAWLLERQ